MTAHYRLRPETISQVIARNHLTQLEFALQLGVCRSHWRAIFNLRHHLTPRMRRRLLACPPLDGIDESELWDIVHSDAQVQP